jgi:regulator of cell morphogenesis and NO signaling
MKPYCLGTHSKIDHRQKIINMQQDPIIKQEAASRKVADWVTENINTAHVFKKYDIDFCCGGGVDLATACNKAGVPIEQVLTELTAVDQEVGADHGYDLWTLRDLADHIEERHHTYVREAIILLLQYSEKVSMVHGGKLPMLNLVRDLVRKISEEMISHMHKEEKILFPYIRYLEGCMNYGDKIDAPPFGTVGNPIRMMETEHEHAGEIMKEISRLTDHYTAPDWACNTFRALYAKLREFEEDLHLHVYIENNILFPKAKNLETNLLESA